MSYHGVVLLLSGYQADEAHIVKQYRAIVEQYVVCWFSYNIYTFLPLYIFIE